MLNSESTNQSTTYLCYLKNNGIYSINIYDNLGTLAVLRIHYYLLLS